MQLNPHKLSLLGPKMDLACFCTALNRTECSSQEVPCEFASHKGTVLTYSSSGKSQAESCAGIEANSCVELSS